MRAIVLKVGTSGWQYRDWKDRFYAGVPQKLWLEHYAKHYSTVEVNNAFYRLPERSTFEQWRQRTPDGFEVGVKISRYLTHIKRLREPAEPVARFLSRAEALEDKLGPVLLQLPPTLRAEPEALEQTLKQFPRTVRLVVEPRHESWFTGETRKILERYGAALCWADRNSRPLGPLWTTADFGYLRMHEGRAKPWPRYGRTALAGWLDRLAPLTEAYVFFNNDPGGAAIVDADAFIALREARRA
ncbi:DUF72 domain-containing protein [Paractinoplanes ferrugineus]|uniref:Histidine kinase n=1 Tax=Paractinoplanes ferrugineus TaxID=113564 RepID=A0A919J5V3_9ACTN|nr:DUF72 domain-containing protein [Actinoplanes ferrugineus]GIE11151.1 histidine kinase [Actinoplanes ferrugineus]